MTLTARPPRAVSLYLTFMSAPVSRIVLMTLSRETKCWPLPHSARRAAVIALMLATALRSMQGICTRPPTGSQVSPRLCSMPISAAFSTWCGVPPMTSARPPAAMEPDDAVVVGAVHEPGVVVQHRRDDAGRAVGGCGDHPAARGVLLVDREREQRHPVHHPQRIRGVGVCHHPLVEAGRAPLHLQTPREYAVGVTAVLHALLHHRPDPQQAAAYLRLGAPRGLVGEHQPGDRQARTVGVFQQLSTGFERVPDRGVVLLDPVRAGRLLVHHEPAADGVVRVLPDRRPGGVERLEDHPVGVVRQRLAPVHHQIVVRVESQLVTAQQAEPAVVPDRGDPGVDAGGVDGLRILALETEQDGLLTAVTVPGGAEGAVPLGGDPGGLGESAVGFQPGGEHPGSAHRAHGVRAGRPDADLEKFENADHAHSLPCGAHPRRAYVAVVATGESATGGPNDWMVETGCDPTLVRSGMAAVGREDPGLPVLAGQRAYVSRLDPYGVGAGGRRDRGRPRS